MLYLTGIAIDFFLLVILISKNNKSDADKILAIWLFCIGLHLASFYLFVTKEFMQYPLILGLEIPLPLVHGPFLYLYTAYLTGQHSSKSAGFLHFLPFALAYIPLLPFLVSPAETKIIAYQNHGEGYEWIKGTINVALLVSGVTYVMLSLHKLNRHKKNITNQFSNTEKINLAWLRYLIFGLSCIWLVIIFGKDEHTFSAVVLYVFFMGYFGIKQTSIFSQNQPLIAEELTSETDPEITNEYISIKEPDLESNTERAKYMKSGLNETELLDIHSQLTELMQREKLYTNPELTLGDTAQQLNVHPNYLSQVINSIANKNFYDYINSQRVEEFIRAVVQPENQKFTLLSLAYECGFNSKTSFNRNFRKITGLTPSAYLKQINISFAREI